MGTSFAASRRWPYGAGQQRITTTRGLRRTTARRTATAPRQRQPITSPPAPTPCPCTTPPRLSPHPSTITTRRPLGSPGPLTALKLAQTSATPAHRHAGWVTPRRSRSSSLSRSTRIRLREIAEGAPSPWSSCATRGAPAASQDARPRGRGERREGAGRY
ncbi:hypothetical protein C8J57DRAFT_295211 [Mycena rebaudengoi]|nr:hypothetical protein C8J57DRAFT_295211 [Mycena rebaudengoi]